jgi:hypothetical protein
MPANLGSGIPAALSSAIQCRIGARGRKTKGWTMLKSIMILWLAFAAIAFMTVCAGCKRNQPPENLIELATDGVRYGLPLKVNNPSDVDEGVRHAVELEKAVTETGLKWTNDHLSFEVIRKAMTLNGKSYGVVVAGDRVTLTEQGVLLVNGTERHSEAETKPSAPHP